MPQKIVWVSLFLLFLGSSLFINLNCAGQFPPSYGPPDLTPPEITVTYPAPKALHFSERKLSLEFSEYVDRRSVEQSIFFSPTVGKRKFNWSGTKVEIEYGDTLLPNTTYIMTIGTDVVDLHSNRMAKAFTLPFSTGDKIDSAWVAGRVFDDSPEGIMIYAFDLQYKHADTLNPALNKPTYLTQTGKNGSFLLPYLREGSYRIMAVRDDYRNIQYDRQIDGYGLLPWDVTLSHDSDHVRGLQYRITKEDTTPPFVSSIKSLDKYRLQLRFSEIIDTSSLRLDFIRAFDTLTQASLDLKDLSVFGDSASSAEIVTSAQEKGKGYRMVIVNLHDLKGNSIVINHGGFEFTGDDAPDTIKPGFHFQKLSDGAKSLEPGDSLFAVFDKPMKKESFEKAFSLTDTAKTILPGKFVWWGSSVAAFVPDKPFQFDTSYIVKVILDSLRDLTSDNRFKDSTVTLHIQGENQSNFSSIKGEVIDESPSGTGNIVIRLFSVSADNTRTREQVIPKPGPFSFDHVPEGRYSFFVYRDADGNGAYTYGRPYPFQPSERFSSFTDTLKLRARWPLEGVVIRINK